MSSYFLYESIKDQDYELQDMTQSFLEKEGVQPI